MLNPALALQLAHDKVATAAALKAPALPHPRTRAIFDADAPPALPCPLVVKPRYASWGRDVVLCADEKAYRRALATLPGSPPRARVVQELVPPLAHDLRVVVAGGDVIGAVKRVAPPGSGARTSRWRDTRSPRSVACGVRARDRGSRVNQPIWSALTSCRSAQAGTSCSS
jgi:glutathione synthase/RimK-type ligase-like ATP-grasp enzyme